MTYYKCVNDSEGYCSGEPTYDVKPSVDTATYLTGDHCKHNPMNCNKYQTFLQSLERQFNDAKAKMKDWPQNDKFVKQLANFEKVKKEAAIKGIT